MAKKMVVVTGDVVVDHHIYQGGHAGVPGAQRGIKVVRKLGGAAGVATLIAEVIGQASAARASERSVALAKFEACEAALKNHSGPDAERKGKADALEAAETAMEEKTKRIPEESWEAKLGLVNLPALEALPCAQHALATWRGYPLNPKRPDERTRVWRAEHLLGFADDSPSGGEPAAKCDDRVPKADRDLVPAELLVLDDGGWSFRDARRKDCWLLPATTDPLATDRWLLLKMSAPVCRGDLWLQLQENFADRMICIVSANDLRDECVTLSKGLSWESTVDDLWNAMKTNPVLKPLGRTRHLIVTFSVDGALWLDNDPKAPCARLVYDAASAEGEWAESYGDHGQAFGYLSCLVAAVAHSVIRSPESPDLARAIAAGLGAMRNLQTFGHGEVGKAAPDGFPTVRLARKLLDGDSQFATARIPWTDEERKCHQVADKSQPWSITESSQCDFPARRQTPLLGLARQLVLQGESAILRLPHARFGDLLSAERSEIETLRNLRRLMLGYKRDTRTTKPLSVGVFGPPGAGKSFGVREIAKGVFEEKAWLEFNLSQFSGAQDLIGAFHLIRDKVLSGITPVVFWDEFDSQGYTWLRHLLAPMQDGRFQDGQLNHAIGKCVFIFAGATSCNFAEFGPSKKDAQAIQGFRLLKGPDFHSRLAAYYDVSGPNQRTKPLGDDPTKRARDTTDVTVPLRRALMIRSLLRVPKSARLDFDPELLDALLRAPNFTHGARSLDRLIAALRPEPADRPIRRSSLPAAAELSMHVPIDKSQPEFSFASMFNANVRFQLAPEIERLAQEIHSHYCERYPTGPKAKPWDQLDLADQEDNRAAARRIPEVIALAGLALVKREDAEESAENQPGVIERHIELHARRLAEAEHDGWMDHRVKNGWRLGDREDAAKLHPLLKPFSDLPEAEQEKDLSSVRDYIAHAKRAGFQIVFQPDPSKPRALA